MKVELIVVGKTDLKTIESLNIMYTERIRHYLSFDIKVLPDVKTPGNLTVEQQKNAESLLIMKNIREQDCVVLLDEKGSEYSSVNFSKFIESRTLEGKKLIFIIGGTFGFSETVYKRAQYKVSLSKMTFSHQIIRVIFLEQLYRAMTIIRNEKYHHE